ncbi:uncharacterized protein LOC125536530 [Triticum urartu]|uniref:uncharacterized protein n=1 Tax=Triticum aestivum TaxID=4565 RepID=UPI001D02881D|nr:uncharacterized protein LOC123188090 [Triticum aestivum]XP_048555722.1 uncharacterized protein LOC125536530 [Triticum urartu]
MEACVSTSRVLLPFPLCAARPADACFRRRAGASRRRGVGLNPATASLDSAAVLLDATVGAGTGYSQARYYTSLGFFVLSVPGLWLLIKRSVKSKGSGMRLKRFGAKPDARNRRRLDDGFAQGFLLGGGKTFPW